MLSTGPNRLIGFLFLLILSFALQSQDVTRDSVWFGHRLKYQSDNPKSERQDLFVDSILKTYMQSPQNCGISIGIYKDGKTWYYNYGLTRRGNGKLPDRYTVYETGALANIFCGLLLTEAVAEKKIDENADIRTYLTGTYKGLQFNGQPITAKHLVSHSSGLPRLPENFRSQEKYDSLNPFQHYTVQMLFNALAETNLKSEPGSESKYSVFGMMVLQAIIEKMYNTTFEELVQQKILGPLKMQSSGATLGFEQKLRLATGYNEDGAAIDYWDFNHFPAAGGIKSCTRDFTFLLKYMMSDSLVASKAKEVKFAGKWESASGWFIRRNKNQSPVYWQNGGTGGFSSFCGFINEKKAGVILLSNSGMNLDYLALSILKFLDR